MPERSYLYKDLLWCSKRDDPLPVKLKLGI